MNTQTNNKRKNSLSNEVKQILSKRGFSFLFNWSDYQLFKTKSKNAFNRAVAISEMFIQENSQSSDFNEYIF